MENLDRNLRGAFGEIFPKKRKRELYIKNIWSMFFTYALLFLSQTKKNLFAEVAILSALALDCCTQKRNICIFRNRDAHSNPER